MAGADAASVKKNVARGDTRGNATCVAPPVPPCPVMPPARFPSGEGIRSAFASVLSAALYIAQKLGAQYACDRPLPNGNKRCVTIWSWPNATNGPSETAVTPAATPAYAASRVATARNAFSFLGSFILRALFCRAKSVRRPGVWCAMRCAANAGAAYAKTCLKCTRTEKRNAASRGAPSLAAATAHSWRPSATPLYWKCTWSTSNNPGLNSTNRAASATGDDALVASSSCFRVFSSPVRRFVAATAPRLAARNAPSANTASAAITEHRWNTTHANEA
mmetsp:Transcript_4308/g.18322  ORF Transcript_4308/g.18322 Transcript_4308/m.18322 type:complete len:277 (+) Transcript_4308:1879-2709(+)